MVLEGTKRAGVDQRRDQVGGGVALAQDQDLSPVVAGVAALRGGEAGEEAGAALAEIDKGLLDQTEARAVAVPGRMDVLRVDLHASAAGGEFMASYQTQVSGIDEEFGLSHPDRKELGDVIVGHGVAVAIDGDKSINRADTVLDAGSVVGVQRERSQERLLLSKHLQLRAAGLLVGAGVAGLGLPPRELAAEVVEVAEPAAIEEALFEFPEATLDAGLVVGVRWATGHRRKLVVRREREEAGVIDWLIPLPPEDHCLLVIVFAFVGSSLESTKGGGVAVHQRVVITAEEDAVALAG